jgi:prevent-host-death family protein
MRRVTATEAARRFADVLDSVERDGETFLIVRRGRPVARLEPANAGRGSEIKALLRCVPDDPAWLDEVREMRAALQVQDPSWLD